jgi:hypothetical protein
MGCLAGIWMEPLKHDCSCMSDDLAETCGIRLADAVAMMTQRTETSTARFALGAEEKHTEHPYH